MLRIKQSRTAILASRLRLRHLKELRASGISDEIILARGYLSAEKESDLTRSGFKEYQCRPPGLLIPVRHVPNLKGYGSKPTVNFQFKPDRPRVNDEGKSIKYETPKGSRVCLDIPPGVEELLEDASVPLVVTEGIKKADSAVSHGIPCIALLGVTCWDVEDWRQVNLKHRKIYICFDSDVVQKREVALAMRRLTQYLRSKGASVERLYLPSQDGGKVGLDDFLEMGNTMKDLFSLTRRPRIDTEIDPSLPVIESQKNDLATMVEEAIQALVFENDPPVIFNHMDRLVRVKKVEIRGKEVPVLEAMDKDSIIDRLSMVANWITVNQNGRVPKNPPDVVARMIKSRGSIDRIPYIRRVATGPIFTSDGVFCSAPGYNPEGQVYLSLDFPVLFRKKLTRKDVDQALEKLNSLIEDFPFECESSRAHAIAFMLLPFARDLIEGPTPIHLFDSPKPGTGKTKLMTTCASVFSLAAGYLENAPKDEDEWRKRLTSSFVEGASHVLLDDVKSINSHALQSAVTNPQRLWKDRILGRNENARAEINVVWGVSGNNFTGRAELLRRCIRIRLNAGIENPASRTGFRIPNLEEYVEKNRAELISACATIIQFWINNGRKPGNPKTKLGGFEAWSDVMSGILECAGVPGFLDNQADLMAQSDDESDSFEAFYADWYRTYGSKWVPAKMVLGIAEKHFDEFDLSMKRNAATVKLGKFLLKLRDTIYGGLKLTMKNQHDGNQFKLTKIGD